MEQQGYNGWTNYATWNYMLWNGDGIKDMVQMTLEMYSETPVEDILDEVIEGALRDLQNVTLDGVDDYFVKDIVEGFFQEIDKEEVINAIKTEFTEQPAK